MEVIRFQTDLLSWYLANQRPLPWRETSDPYKIWLSEIMLQQTQVVTVIDYFNRFVSAYPAVQDLAKAEEDDVLKLWEGLGYYSRARNLMRCAKILASNYGGAFPRDLKTMLSLPGIGPYTAGAVLSIAFNMPVPAVDGNVLRVFARLTESYADIGDPKTRPLAENWVRTVLPEDRRHFNQALMELGARVCTPKNPDCGRCPVAADCLAKAHETVSELPVKVQKIKKSRHTTAVAYVTCQGRTLLVKRSGEGLLAGLWGFPAVELPPGADAQTQLSALTAWLEEHLGMSAKPQDSIASAKHIFTHKTWDMVLWAFESQEMPLLDHPPCLWVDRSEIQRYALPTAFVKLLRASR